VVFVVAFGMAVVDMELMGAVRSVVAFLSTWTWGCLWGCKKESEG
jgi:MFS-type transporter involved in bile tolerance (Atg22 family)